MKRDPGAEPLGATIRRLRRLGGLSLQQAAARLGVHFTTVAAWERGRSRPPHRLLPQLAELLGVPALRLLDPRPEPRGPAFRPLAANQGEALLRRLEELRLLSCLRAEMAGTGAMPFSQRTGIAAERLDRLCRGAVEPRPTEMAALVLELGAPGEEVLVEGAMGHESALPAEAWDRLVEALHAYVSGHETKSGGSPRPGSRRRAP
jgi:transcriptional regulator with XRE-family HTH domain